jgi:hypothetical protein
MVRVSDSVLRRVGLFGVAIALCGLWVTGGSARAAASSSCVPSGATVTCTYTGAGVASFSVPSGVSSLDVVAVGAAGGGSFGGQGASVEDLAVPVTSDSSLQVVVGGAGGAGGSPGGGGSPGIVDAGAGGGFSGVFGAGPLSQGSALVIGAGGGGSAFSEGGEGGGGAGDTGTGGGAGDPTTACGGATNTGCGGGGATSTMGGGGGADCNSLSSGGSGSALHGGDGNAGLSVDGGGGGGGYFGGGGGGADGGCAPPTGAGGGGGGSSFGITGLTHEVNTSAPASVKIIYTVPVSTPPKATPSIATTPSATQVQVGQSISDSATVTGGRNPTGTVTFKLFANGSCSGTAAFASSNRPLSGKTADSTSFTTTKAGTFHWVAAYNGDVNNNSVSTSCSGQTVTVTAPTQPRAKITAATISSKLHRASFKFKASGARGFQCALVKQPPGKHHKKPKPSYRACKSPKTYKHLKRGRYTFYVRALGAAGPGTPATKKFKIA